MSGRAGAEPTPPPQPTQVAGVLSRIACNALARPPGLRRHSQAPSGAALSSSGRRLATTTNELWRITEGYRKLTNELYRQWSIRQEAAHEGQNHRYAGFPGARPTKHEAWLWQRVVRADSTAT